MSKPLYDLRLEDATITLSTGNQKIGMMINWSTLPGNKDNMLVAKGQLLTDVEGSCSKNCQGCFKNCYARRSAMVHHNAVVPAWGYNTLLMRYRMNETFEEIDKQIRTLNKKYYQTGKIDDLRYKFYRHNVSGELSCLEELEGLNELAKKHPEIKFGIYSKASDILIEFFEKHSQTADNLTINLSEWHGVMKETRAKLDAMGAKYNIFEYDDSNLKNNDLTQEQIDELKRHPHCPAVGATKENKHPINPATGERWKCDDCKGCYTKSGVHKCVYAH